MNDLADGDVIDKLFRIAYDQIFQPNRLFPLLFVHYLVSHNDNLSHSRTKQKKQLCSIQCFPKTMKKHKNFYD